MFVVTKEPVAWMRVEWTSLDEAGDQVANSFRMKVALVPLERFERFMISFAGGQAIAAVQDSLALGDRPPLEGPVAFIKDVALDWDEIVGPDKRPFAFTPDNLDLVAQFPGFLNGWQLSYTRAWYGQTGEREKNSPGSPGDGRAAPPPNRKARRASSSSSRR